MAHITVRASVHISDRLVYACSNQLIASTKGPKIDMRAWLLMKRSQYPITNWALLMIIEVSMNESLAALTAWQNPSLRSATPRHVFYIEYQPFSKAVVRKCLTSFTTCQVSLQSEQNWYLVKILTKILLEAIAVAMDGWPSIFLAIRLKTCKAQLIPIMCGWSYVIFFYERGM